MSPPSPTLTPRTLRRAVTRFPRLAADAYLVIEDGDGIVVLDLPAGRTSVGRSYGADVELDDPSVSRRHALLIRDAAGVRILDDRSEAGVHVNGVRTAGRLLCDGDRIEVGRVRMRFVVTARPAARAG